MKNTTNLTSVNVYIEQLTFTRFLAVITVVTYHFGYTYYPLNIYPWSNLFLLGPISVCYFFTLSGFIMSVNYYETGIDKFDKYKFWKIRIARISPVYLLALFIIFPTTYRLGNNDVAGLLLNISMLQAWIPPYPLTYNFPGWSLSVEAFFYLIFPFLLILIRKYGFKDIFLATVIIWTISQILHIYALNNFHPVFPSKEYDIIYYNPLTHLNTFIIGVVGGVYYVHNRHIMRSKRQFNSIALWTCILIICSVLLCRHRFSEYLGFTLALENGLISPLFIIFIIFFSLETKY